MKDEKFEFAFIGLTRDGIGKQEVRTEFKIVGTSLEDVTKTATVKLGKPVKFLALISMTQIAVPSNPPGEQRGR